MVNPLSAAYNMFLGFINILPTPILNLILLIVAVFVIVGIVQIIRSH